MKVNVIKLRDDYPLRVISSGARNLMNHNYVILARIRFLTFVRNDNKKP